VSFSIHLAAEGKKIPIAELSEQYNNLEKGMLKEYFEFLTSRQDASLLHWNMRDANYGFVAIEHRFQVLNGNPFVVPDQNKIDLSRLLVDIYGKAYAGHPRPGSCR
jgi:hypothetical protein